MLSCLTQLYMFVILSYTIIDVCYVILSYTIIDVCYLVLYYYRCVMLSCLTLYGTLEGNTVI